MSLTDKSVLDTTSDMSIRIKCDKENHILSITDTGVGMTKQDLITNLGKKEFWLLLYLYVFTFTIQVQRQQRGWCQKMEIFADLQYYLIMLT